MAGDVRQTLKFPQQSNEYYLDFVGYVPLDIYYRVCDAGLDECLEAIVDLEATDCSYLLVYLENVDYSLVMDCDWLKC